MGLTIGKATNWLSVGMGKPLLINLYGGPGAGKTTTALALAGNLKMRGYEAEYVPEYARELALEGKLTGCPQFDILMEQTKRLIRAIGTGIEVVITDSPILLQSLYAAYEADRVRAVVLHTALATVFDMRDFIITNDRESHSMVGRVTPKVIAMQKDAECLTALQDVGACYEVTKKEAALDYILSRCIAALQ